MTEYMKQFSHIYVEKEAYRFERTKRVIDSFPGAEVIEVRDYRDVFNRKNQDAGIQHKSQKLILAVKKDGFLYKGAPVCQSFGEEEFYYTSNVMNCVYDCEYCFLKGMYPTSNIVIFVNLEDTFAEIEKTVGEKKSGSRETGSGSKIYVSVSYESDMLAIEGFTGMLADWASWVDGKDSVLLEVRTKCVNVPLADWPPNMIAALTMSPDEVISKYERYTPGLGARCRAANEMISKGIPVRLCFDPMMYVKGYKEAYSNMVDIISNGLDWNKLRDVSLGSFRISKDYIKNFRKSYPDSSVAFFPYELENGYYQYPEMIRMEMEDFLYDILREKLSDDKIFRWK